MEKKNINIWVVRTCTILLLTVFTIGRKYGQDQNAENLINDLKQQPCACCLNFNEVEASAKTIDGKKQELEVQKGELEVQNGNLVIEKEELKVQNGDLEEQKANLELQKEELENKYAQIEKEKNDIDFSLQQQNFKIENLNKVNMEINEEKGKLENQNKAFFNLYKESREKNSNLEQMLKNAKTNVKTEECVKFYNSIFGEKKAKIEYLFNADSKDILTPKECKFYIPFKFKNCGDCFYGKNMHSYFNHNVGNYAGNKSLENILKSLFIRYGIEQINKDKIIDVKILKEIYFYVKFRYDENKIIKSIDNFDNITVPNNCFYPTEKNKGENNYYKYNSIAGGDCYKAYKDKILLNYYEFIKLVGIDEYLEKKEKNGDLKDLFLLELDFEDPECIALLEFVGKGNYGVVKKGLTFENGELVTKAIKFTCSNSEFPNSFEGNIQKEIRAGMIINEIGVGNKIAFVKDYMKIDKFIKRYNWNDEEKKIDPLDEETKKGDLKNAVYTTLLNDNLETLPTGTKNVYKTFKNNVFSYDGTIGKDLYIMFMNIVNGTDLFLSKKKEEIDIDILGKILFDVLNNLYINHVALKDIKPKNIIFDEKKKDFSIIDVQTLGLVDRDLTDSFGTPELWPFFKTLNLNLSIKDEIIDEGKKNNLYDVFCCSIDDNFVDIYAACMTMYFTKFNTYTAAGLLTLLLKWIILDEKKKVKIEDKINFLKDYKKNYDIYIDIKKKIEHVGVDNDSIKCFFEEIDDKNLNNIQKELLANLLKQVISLGNKSNIFYLLKEINEKYVKVEENKYSLNDYIEPIMEFYKECVDKDFKNFAKLDQEKCKYADVIKYVLCYGSCLNYNGENKEMDVNSILKKLQLKQDIKIQDKEFFGNINKVNVIDNLRSGFNQTFIIVLLKILPLEEYYEILEHDVSTNSVNYYFDNKEKAKGKQIKEEEIESKKKAFYLLRYLDMKKLFHIPKDLLKINSLINKNTDDKDDFFNL